jgi:hypothetical protein
LWVFRVDEVLKHGDWVKGAILILLFSGVLVSDLLDRKQLRRLWEVLWFVSGYRDAVPEVFKFGGSLIAEFKVVLGFFLSRWEPGIWGGVFGVVILVWVVELVRIGVVLVRVGVVVLVRVGVVVLVRVWVGLLVGVWVGLLVGVVVLVRVWVGLLVRVWVSLLVRVGVCVLVRVGWKNEVLVRVRRKN